MIVEQRCFEDGFYVLVYNAREETRFGNTEGDTCTHEVRVAIDNTQHTKTQNSQRTYFLTKPMSALILWNGQNEIVMLDKKRT